MTDKELAKLGLSFIGVILFALAYPFLKIADWIIYWLTKER